MTETKRQPGGIGGHHHHTPNRTDEWLTPREILNVLGEFDLDPSSPVDRPWPTARQHFTKREDGLMRPWHGRVWLNPPYGRMTGNWMERLALHGNGVALVFARTDTAWFHRLVFGSADAVLFMLGRIAFCRADGTQMTHNSGGPSCLVAYGDQNVGTLAVCGLAGKFLKLRGRSYA